MRIRRTAENRLTNRSPATEHDGSSDKIIFVLGKFRASCASYQVGLQRSTKQLSGEENKLESRKLSSFIFAGRGVSTEAARGDSRFAPPPECIKICYTERAGNFVWRAQP